MNIKGVCSSFLRNVLAVNNSQPVRYLPRWHSRRPSRVISSEEYDAENDRPITPQKENNEDHESIEETSLHVKHRGEERKDDSKQKKTQHSSEPFKNEFRAGSKIKWRHNSPLDTSKKEEKRDKPIAFKLSADTKPLTISKQTTVKKNTFDMLQTVIDQDGNFIYTKMKDNDSRITTILVEVKSKKEKEKNDLILLEGKRLIKDALDSGCQLKYILFSRQKEVEYLRSSLPKMGALLYKMPYNEMQTWSGLTTNPGIMGVFKIPDLETIEPAPDSLPITIICDNIRESSNLGAVLRTCSGVGTQEVVLTKGCVNVWDSKVLRSACGAHFKLRIKRKQEWDAIVDNLPPNSEVYVADNQIVSGTGDSNHIAGAIESVPVVPYYSADFRHANHIVLIIGGETEGISESSYKLAAEKNGVRLNVPLSNGVDSLNTGTALGIIAFEIKKQLSTKKPKVSEESPPLNNKIEQLL